MIKITVDDILAFEPCDDYSKERILELWNGKKALTIPEIVALDIPSIDKFWVLVEFVSMDVLLTLAEWCRAKYAKDVDLYVKELFNSLAPCFAGEYDEEVGLIPTEDELVTPAEVVWDMCRYSAAVNAEPPEDFFKQAVAIITTVVGAKKKKRSAREMRELHGYAPLTEEAEAANLLSNLHQLDMDRK